MEDQALITINRIEHSYQHSSNFKLEIRGLQLFKGSITTILGRSGSGKSTFLDIISFILSPLPASTYEIEYAFNTVNTPVSYSFLWKNERLLNNIKKNKLGYIFQRSFFLPEVNLKENIRIPMILKGISTDEQKNKLAGLFDLDLFIDKEKKTGNELAWECSGGQLQRLSLLRAISHDPELLFLDEPTGDLDSTSAEAVFSFLRNWCKQSADRSIIMVTHDINLASKYADHILILDNSNSLPESNIFKRSGKQDWLNKGGQAITEDGMIEFVKNIYNKSI